MEIRIIATLDEHGNPNRIEVTTPSPVLLSGAKSRAALREVRKFLLSAIENDEDD